MITDCVIQISRGTDFLGTKTMTRPALIDLSESAENQVGSLDPPEMSIDHGPGPLGFLDAKDVFVFQILLEESKFPVHDTPITTEKRPSIPSHCSKIGFVPSRGTRQERVKHTTLWQQLGQQ